MDDFLNSFEMDQFDVWLNESMNNDILDLDMINDCYMMEKKEDDPNTLLEKVKKLGKKLKDMLDKVLKAIKKAALAIIDKVKKKLTSAKIKLQIKHIKMMRKDKQIEFIDVWKLEKTLMAEAMELGVLCSKWAESYANKGKGVMAANKFEDAFNHIVRTHEEKIERIKKEKIQVSSLKVKKWLLKNTQFNEKLCGPMNTYAKQIEKSKKMLKEIHAKKEIFIKEVGYDNGPVTFTRVVHNGMGYVKRNADWISMYFLSALTFLGSRAYKDHTLKNVAKYDIDIQGGDEATIDPETGVATVNYKNKDVRNKARQKYREHNVAKKEKKRIKAMDAVSGAFAAAGAYTMNNANKEELRNTI